MIAESYTNSSTSCARSCPRKYQLSYIERLKSDGPDSEALSVGSCWHGMLDAHNLAGLPIARDSADVLTPYEYADKHALSPLWAEKLKRLFSGYLWYWGGDQLETIQSERAFEVTIDGIVMRGQIDREVKTADGRVGIIESKTSSEDLAPDSPFWDRIRMGTQPGIYRSVSKAAFLIYDVVKKPGIKPKAITKKDLTRMENELGDLGECTYQREQFSRDEFEEARAAGQESLRMYGARLAALIYENPAKVYARQEVPLADDSEKHLWRDIQATVVTLESYEQEGYYPRNPDACFTYNTPCQFSSLCRDNYVPIEGNVPNGFKVRNQLHPELPQ